jgi:hypothetical protein
MLISQREARVSAISNKQQEIDMDVIGNMFDGYVALGAVGMAVVGVGFLAMLAFAFAERGWQAFLGLAALVGGAAVFGGSHPWSTVVDHPWLSAMGFFGYFAIGSFWSVAKFRLYTGSLKHKFKEFKAQWLEKAEAQGLPSLTPADLDEFRANAKSHMRLLSRHGDYPVKPQEHKAVILFWMGWWPVSMLAYVLDEPIKRVMDALYRMFAGVYAKIAHDQSKEFLADMGK